MNAYLADFSYLRLLKLSSNFCSSLLGANFDSNSMDEILFPHNLTCRVGAFQMNLKKRYEKYMKFRDSKLFKISIVPSSFYIYIKKKLKYIILLSRFII